MTEAEKRVPVKVLRGKEAIALAKAPRDQRKAAKRERPAHLSMLDNAPSLLEYSNTPRNNALEPWRGRAELFDSGTEYRVLVEIRGVSKEEIEILMAERNVGIVAGTRSFSVGEKGTLFLSGGIGTKILRRVTFPEEVIAELAIANLNNGMLEVRVPKRRPTATSGHRTLHCSVA